MDLSRLSDAELLALKAGDYSKLSDETLLALSGKQPEAKGALYAAGSGALRAIPQGLDFVMGVGGEAVNQAAGAVGLPKAPFGEIYNNSTYFNDGLSKVIGPEYDAQGLGENASKIAGSVIGPVGAVKGAKNFMGFLQGLGGSLDNYIRDPQKLKELYLSWKQGLEQVPVTPKEARRELINPVLEEIGPDARFATKEGKEKLAEMEAVLQEDGNTLAEVYALRKSLGNVKDNAITEPIRNQTKTFMAERVGDEGLDAYRRAMVFEDVNHALRNMGNEGIKATRTKLSNLDETGMSAAEIAAKQSAVSGGLREALMRGGQSALGAIPAAIVGGPAAPALYAVGRSLGAGADSMAKGRITALQEVLLNKRAAPNMGEKAGNMLRKVLQGK